MKPLIIENHFNFPKCMTMTMFLSEQDFTRHTSPQDSCSSSSITLISPEVLLYIFLFNTTPDNRSKTSEWVDCGRTTRYTSQVCRDWREIALTCPTLWRHAIDVSQNSTDWVKELLRRSQPLSIDICAYTRHFANSQCMDIALQHASRFRNVQVMVQYSFWDTLTSHLLQPTPHLETLHLEVAGESPNWTSPQLPTTLFSGDAPNLRRLELARCTFNFISPILHNLTELKITTVFAHLVPTISKLLDILSNTPLLERLDLFRIEGPPSNHDDDLFMDTRSPVELPHLKVLELSADMDDCTNLLTNVIIPSSCVFRLDCTAIQTGSALNKLISVIEQKLASRNLVNYPLALSLDTTGISIDSRDPERELEPQATELAFFILLSWREWGQQEEGFETFFPLLLPIFEEVSLRITSLYLPIDDETEMDFLSRQILSSYTAIERVEGINKCMPPEFFHAFQPKSFAGDSALLPSLRTIGFRNVDFKSRWGKDPCFFDQLLSFIRWRSHLGLPVEAVKLRYCRITKEEVEQLKVWGVKINWDGLNKMEDDQ